MDKFKTLLKNLACGNTLYISIGFLMTALGLMSVRFFILTIPFCMSFDLLYLYLSGRLFDNVCVNKKKVLALVLSLLMFICMSTGFAYKSARRPITVITYHRINYTTLGSATPTMTPKEFDNQMKFFKKHGYTSISSEDMDKYYGGQRVRLPKKPLLVTFDDGWRDNYDNALPILKKYNMKATIFLITGRIGNKDYLTWDMVKKMQKEGISFGAHTRDHINLGKNNKDEDYAEIKESYNDIVKNLGVKPISFCYPYGGGDMKPSIQKLVKQAGFDIAFASDNFGINNSNVNKYAVRRILMPRYRILHGAELTLLAW